MHTATIAKRELGAFFKSPIAYIVLAIYLVFHGTWFFIFQGFFTVGQADMEGFFGLLPFVFAFIGPALAMRLLAEEKGSGTIELLLTMPIRDGSVVIGKYVAALAVLFVGLLLTLPYAITISTIGPLDWGPVIAGYVGALLLGGTYVAIGLFFSAMTRNQIIALVAGILVCLFLAFMHLAVPSLPAWLGKIVLYASPQYHFLRIARGVFDLRDIVYYASIIGVLLVGSVQVLESRKWR
jgi:ABC-2 type transport system permease protein